MKIKILMFLSYEGVKQAVKDNCFISVYRSIVYSIVMLRIA